MIEFTCPTVGDKKWVQEILSQCDFFTCESAFGNLYSYTAVMGVEIARIGGCLVVKWYTDKELSYAYPLGKGDRKKAMEYIISDGKRYNDNYTVFDVPPAYLEELAEFFPDMFEIKANRDAYDYIYSSEDLINLKGKKYQPKRDHISYFEKNNNWTYEKITRKNIPECIAMSEKWLEKNKREDNKPLERELLIIKKSFDSFETLGYVGGLLRVDGEVVAYTMGERMTDDMFCVHIEKAYADIRGTYPMINREFVKNELSSYKYIDREDDAGEENLRKAKLSYYPAIMAEKYEARVKKC